MKIKRSVKKTPFGTIETITKEMSLNELINEWNKITEDNYNDFRKTVFVKSDIKKRKVNIMSNEENEARRVEAERQDKKFIEDVLQEIPQTIIQLINGSKQKSFILNSIHELINNGKTRTGLSQKSGKIIWTFELCDILTKLGVKYKYGNDAPRHGGNGEWVTADQERMAYLKEMDSLIF